MKIKFKEINEHDQQEIISLLIFKKLLKKQFTKESESVIIKERERER